MCHSGLSFAVFTLPCYTACLLSVPFRDVCRTPPVYVLGGAWRLDVSPLGSYDPDVATLLLLFFSFFCMVYILHCLYSLTMNCFSTVFTKPCSAVRPFGRKSVNKIIGIVMVIPGYTGLRFSQCLNVSFVLVFTSVR